MREFDKYSGHVGRNDLAGDIGITTIVDRVAPSIDWTTLVAEGVVIVGVQEFDEHSGHPGRTDISNRDGFVVIVDRIITFIDRTTRVAAGVVIGGMQ